MRVEGKVIDYLWGPPHSMIPFQGWFWTVVSDEEKKELYEGQPSNGGKQLATQLLIFWPIFIELCVQYVGLDEYEGLSKGEYSKL